MAQEDQLTEIAGPKKVAPKYVKQKTIQYKTFLKRAVVEAIQNSFSTHPDASLAKTKIGIEYSTDRADFPAIIVKFYERELANAGVGHEEWGPSPEDPNFDVPGGPWTMWIKYYHRIYKGDLEFEIYAKTSLDRDKVADALIEVLAMADVAAVSEKFQERIYDSIGKTPAAGEHFITINTDLITGYGEQQMIAPWMPEDTMVYQSSYRVPMLGEFYSLTPSILTSMGLVTEVDVYPWDPQDTEDTAPEDFPEEVIPEEDYLKFKEKEA